MVHHIFKHRATEPKCDIIITYVGILQHASRRRTHGSIGTSKLAVTAFLSLSAHMPQIRQLLSYTYFPIKYSKPFNHVHSRALNNPLTLTGSMSSQTRQHLPLYQSNVELKSTLYFTMFCFGFSEAPVSSNDCF